MIKVWLVTWNLEYNGADTVALGLAAKITAAGANAPDVIITAEQESV